LTFALDHVRRKKRARPEDELHIRVARLLDVWLEPGVFWLHVPNGGTRNVIEAVQFKRRGVKPGVPDLIFIHAGKVTGIELKSDVGRLSDNQRHTQALMRAAGCRIETARSENEVYELLKAFGIPLRGRIAA